MADREDAIEPFACPRCGYPQDSATQVFGEDPARPKPGDVLLCLWCGAPTELRADGSPRWLTFDEVQQLSREGKARLAMAWSAVLTLRPSRVRYRMDK